MRNESISIESRMQAEIPRRGERQFDLKTRMIRNCARDRLGKIAAELLLPIVIREAADSGRAVFSTPFGTRRLGSFHPETREAVETRNSRAVANRLTRSQVMKDAYLLKTRQVSQVTWMLYFGASPRLLALLDAHDIRHVEGWQALLAAGRTNPPKIS